MRPHWGKLHGITHTELISTYPHMRQFLRIRQEVDPDNIFVNDYLRDIFHL